MPVVRADHIVRAFCTRRRAITKAFIGSPLCWLNSIDTAQVVMLSRKTSDQVFEAGAGASPTGRLKHVTYQFVKTIAIA